jgi:CheY-like chemotaxis protein
VRILVADDNRDAADSLAMLLEIRGHDARATYDGGEAVTVAADWVPDAAILDIRMPVLDGWAVAKALRERRPGMVLIALSGQVHPATIDRYPGLFDAVYIKGRSDDLFHRLDTLLSGAEPH